jgi:large subunit ribosomal protein L17
MRHQKKTVKLGRTAEHRKALLANQVCSLIEHSRIKTTLAKAKAVRPLAEKMVTLGKKGTLHNRRTAISYLRHPDSVKKLFEDIAPRSLSRAGGYTRIIKLGPRPSDSAPMAFIEWVDAAPGTDTDEAAPKVVTVKEKPAKKVWPEGKKPGSVRARKVTDKVKRAKSKLKKQNAAKLRASKPKVVAKSKKRA